MDQEDYSRADALFVLSSGASGFELTNLVFSATVPGASADAAEGDLSGLFVTISSKSGDGDNDNDDDDDLSLKVGLFVFIALLLICVITCFACCACCPGYCGCCRRSKEDKQTID